MTRSAPVGRSTGKLSRKQRGANSAPEGEPFIQISKSMFESHAMRQLSRAAMLVLNRLIVEHLAHGGRENGRLKATFKDFEEFGVNRHSILRAIIEVEKLGFAQRVEVGRRYHGMDKGCPSIFRLTFMGVLIGNGYAEPTNDWRKITTRDEAIAIVDEIQAELAERTRKRRKALPNGSGCIRTSATANAFGEASTTIQRSLTKACG